MPSLTPTFSLRRLKSRKASTMPPTSQDEYGPQSSMVFLTAGKATPKFHRRNSSPDCRRFTLIQRAASPSDSIRALYMLTPPGSPKLEPTFTPFCLSEDPSASPNAGLPPPDLDLDEGKARFSLRSSMFAPRDDEIYSLRDLPSLDFDTHSHLYEEDAAPDSDIEEHSDTEEPISMPSRGRTMRPPTSYTYTTASVYSQDTAPGEYLSFPMPPFLLGKPTSATSRYSHRQSALAATYRSLHRPATLFTSTTLSMYSQDSADTALRGQLEATPALKLPNQALCEQNGLNNGTVPTLDDGIIHQEANEAGPLSVSIVTPGLDDTLPNHAETIHLSSVADAQGSAATGNITLAGFSATDPISPTKDEKPTAPDKEGDLFSGLPNASRPSLAYQRRPATLKKKRPPLPLPPPSSSAPFFSKFGSSNLKRASSERVKKTSLPSDSGISKFNISSPYPLAKGTRATASTSRLPTRPEISSPINVDFRFYTAMKATSKSKCELTTTAPSESMSETTYTPVATKMLFRQRSFSDRNIFDDDGVVALPSSRPFARSDPSNPVKF
ncbi:hypothetical protein CPC08DRAFT_766589 [Agrocybe pediades]|nr:hypothetical protein CPC08DRAFT_766589 [Agrocybe pediades]